MDVACQQGALTTSGDLVPSHWEIAIVFHIVTVVIPELTVILGLRFNHPLNNSKKWIVLSAAFICNFLGGSLGYSAGIIHIGLLEKYNQSQLVTSLASALFTSVFCLAGPLSSIVINASSCRLAIIIGGSLNLVAFTVSGVASSLEVICVFYGVVASTGQSLVYSGSVVAAGYYFEENRSLATGFVVCGTGLGILTFPPLTQGLINYYSLDGTFLLLGAICFQSCVFAALIRPHSLEIKRKKEMGDSLSLRNQLRLVHICDSLRSYVKILQNVPFIFLCLSMLMWSMGMNICVLYLPEFYISTGSTGLQASFFMSIFGLGNLASRLFTGLAAADDTIDGKVIYFGSYGVLGLFTICIPLYGSYQVGKIIYSAAFGLYSGAGFSLMVPMSVECVGLNNMATSFGLQLLLAGVGFFVGPYLGGVLLGDHKNFDGVFIFTGILYFLASTFVILMTLSKSLKQNDSNQQLDVCDENEAEKETVSYVTDANKNCAELFEEHEELLTKGTICEA